jgi:uncharacterized protein YndB with AHSA1/START domain
MTPADKIPDPRKIEAEVEVPGTPEEVWDAIATGPGITAWFMPTEVAEHEGGELRMNHGPVWEATGVVTAWDRPRRFAYDEEFQPDEAAAPTTIATEFLVEARSGDTCVVRVVMSGFGTGDDWDRAIESFETGWQTVLQSLRLYMTHFPGRRAASITIAGSAAGPIGRAWAEVTGALGLNDAAEGERTATSANGVPALGGTVVRKEDRGLLLLVDEPAPGLGLIATGGPGEQIGVYLRAQLFGDGAAEIAARDEPAWRAWIAEHFPPAG